MGLKVVHLTTVHPVFDIRIFHKECKTLARQGHEVFLVAPHLRNEQVDGVHIKALPIMKNRLIRMIWLNIKAFVSAYKLKADVYHFHDPELNGIGLILKWFGKKVVYDVHEDAPRDILSKAWIPLFLRKRIARIVERIENFGAKKYDLIVAATPTIQKRFLNANIHTVCVKNYPIIEEFHPTSSYPKKRQACYVGVLNETKGLYSMLEAMEYLTDINLVLAGSFSYSQEYNQIQQHEGWKKCEWKGVLDRQGVATIFEEAMVGLVLLMPEPNFVEALPIKMFEYMCAGIPVIASSFPVYRDIVETAECGFVVDPLNPKEIAAAMQWLMDHPEHAKKMGENGRKAVEEHMNWGQQSEILLTAYEELENRVRN